MSFTNFKQKDVQPAGIFYTDTVSVIVQCALRLLNYKSYSIGIIPETLLD